MLAGVGLTIDALPDVWLAATRWPHAELVLRVIASVAMQPLAIPLYVAIFVFEVGVSVTLSRIALWEAIRAGIILDRSERQRQLVRLGHCMRRDGVRTAAALTFPILLAGMVGMTYLREWSLDNVMAGLILIGAMLVLSMPMTPVGYAVFRYYLLKHGCFIPHGKPDVDLRRTR